ncbi:MAG: pantoate--beta-alanine ligase [Prevotellaceae bacterium]|jgi:pantoate--beta-alanine ligase|nr:pantoate--beta-alanine ligase [Prevotellaceae bacterium]
MEKYTKVSELKTRLSELKKDKTTGFTPTMGALHQGHLSLIALNKSMCDITVASIFVNPTQFNDKGDYQRYPRTLERDIKMLDDVGCDIVFIPSEDEIYPERDDRIFDFGELDKVMEGKFRPGHFNGVAQVVSRLFDIVNPDKAFFGQKDFQQVCIIKDMVKQLHLPIEIVVAPIIREQDGLAMSSRNMLLTETQRKEAGKISQVLFYAKEQAIKTPVNEIRNETIRRINSSPELKVEYLEIVDANTLQSVSGWNDSAGIFICTAVHVGKIRLIDNVQLK